ncbi:MAG: hypothetical protein HY263_04145 [Chloroflexi bacterium]|nr:hypothetical protein [Chloroflexota bacterium]
MALLIPMHLAWVFMLYGGLQVIAHGSAAVGLVLLVAGAITAYLALRRLAAEARTSTDPASGELSGPAFDYIVWTALGLPVLLAVVLLVGVLAGGMR